MNNDGLPVRVFGQRSISSSFLSCSSNPFKSSNEDSQSKSSKKSSHLSLSDFLDRKLPETSVQQRMVKKKSTPFSSLQGPKDSNSSINGPIGIHSGTDSQTESAISKVLFEQFKRSEPNQGECLVSGSASEADFFNTDEMLEPRKRKKSNEGFVSSPPCESRTRKKNVVVLGSDPKPEQKGKEPIHTRNKQPRPLYNHYASGGGWWDCNMEGVDSEEVGVGEVWEGVGSTTLGGIEWH